MNGRGFAQRRARILKSGRPERTQRKAIAHLAREAGAVPWYAGRRLVGHEMPSGTFICELRRYPTRAAATVELDQVQAFAHLKDGPVPERAFPCDQCHGWHVAKNRR